jgi:protein tyrosine/serine phosphatase
VKKKNPLRAVVIIIIIAAVIVLLVRHFHIKNFHIIKPGMLYTSGQPKGMDYTRLLYKYHIATIINLRSPAEHREQNWYNAEITWVRTHGVKYIEMPLDRDINNPRHFPDAKMQEQFLAIMADRENIPVLVHDGSGESRVAMLAALWLINSEHLPTPQVLATAEKIKNCPLAESEKNFINGLSK